MIFFRLTFVFALVFATVELCAAPKISRLSAWGGQRGSEFDLVIHGSSLLPNPHLELGLSAPKTLITEGDLAPKVDRVAFRIRIQEIDACGVLPLRVRTADGLSNLQLFRIGAFAEVAERPPTHTLQLAQSLTLPCTVNGWFDGVSLDHYRFEADKGQRFVFEVEGRRLGSAADPTLYLLNKGGGALAMSEDASGLRGDCRIDYTFAESGTYYLRVHEALYAARNPAFYRLTIGDFDYAEEVNPAGGRRGSELLVEFRGGSLGAPVRQRVSLSSNGTLDVPVSLPSDPSGGAPFPFFLRVDDLPELVEDRPETADGSVPVEVDAPVVVNGRLSAADEVDRYAFAVEPGSRWEFTVESRRIDSRMDAYLEVFNTSGGRLAAADDAQTDPDPRLDFTVPAGLDRLIISVEDLHRHGGVGYTYRLVLRRLEAPGFELRLSTDVLNVPIGGRQSIAVDVERRGYDGDVEIRVSGYPGRRGRTRRGQKGQGSGVLVGTSAILAGYTRGFVSVSAPTDAMARDFDLRIYGVGQINDTRIERRARGTVYLASDGENPIAPVRFQLVRTSVTAPFPLKIETETLDVVPSLDFTFPVQLERGDGVSGEVLVSGRCTRGVVFSEVKIAGDKSEGGIVVQVPINHPVGSTDTFTLTATSVVSGREVVATTPLLSLKSVAPFVLELPSALEAHAGKEAVIRGKVKRTAHYKNAVSVKVSDIPPGKAEQTVAIEAAKSDVVLKIAVPEDLAPGDYPLRVVGSTTLTRAKQTASYMSSAVDVLLRGLPAASASGAK